MTFQDTIKLSFDNNLIIGNLPDKIELSKLEEKMRKDSDAKVKDSLESFGLFDTNQSNYNTYYPEVTAEDLTPKEEEFIQPVFRALSKVIAHKEYNPVDFGMNDVLKNSMGLLKGASINADHETSIGNAMGAVKDVSWQEVSKTSNGILIPAGINAKLKIDGKSHPRVARAIMMDPPAIHSTSVTVQFLWEKSHASLSQEDFFKRLGSKDSDGKIIRRVANRIQRYHEISLVSHGADPYAQLIKDAQIVNPTWGDISYNSITGPQKQKQKYFFFDFKTDVISNTIPNEHIDNNSKNQTNHMNKEFLIALAAVMGLTLANSEEPGETEIKLIQDGVSGLVTSNKTLTEQNTANKTELDRLKAVETKYNEEKATFAEAVNLKAFKDASTTSLREKVTNTYKMIQGDKLQENDAIIGLLKNASYETLSALKIQYDAQLEEKFPMTCKECGGHEVNRASATQPSGEGGAHKETTPTNIRKIAKNKAKAHGVSMFEKA
jgi:hypothetical protein